MPGWRGWRELYVDLRGMKARSGCGVLEGFGMKPHQGTTLTCYSHRSNAGGGNVLSSYEIRFRQITFTCGEVQDQGKQRRFLYSTPYKINLPMYEPLPGDARSSSWQVVYRTICEKTKQRSRLAAAH